LVECICNFLSKDLQHRPDATSASKELAVCGTILGLPAFEPLTKVRKNGWDTLSENLPLDRLFSGLIHLLAEGKEDEHTSFLKAIAQNLYEESRARNFVSKRAA
jgi:hypothetical protein